MFMWCYFISTKTKIEEDSLCPLTGEGSHYLFVVMAVNMLPAFC